MACCPRCVSSPFIIDRRSAKAVGAGGGRTDRYGSEDDAEDR